jgi:hypothetical protein
VAKRDVTNPNDGVEVSMTLWSRISGALVVGWLATFAVTPVAAQTSFGGYGVRVAETINGDQAAQGIGVRAGLSFPLFPLKAYAAAERIFPDCPESGCSVWAAEAGLTLNLFPLPLASPYLTGGVVRRRYDSGIDGAPGGAVTTVDGISAGLGVSAGVPGISFFLEGRYEFMDAPYDQFVLRLGVMF